MYKNKKVEGLYPLNLFSGIWQNVNMNNVKVNDIGQPHEN